MNTKEKLYDVVAVSDNNKILWVEPNKTLRNAEAIENMAIMRQGTADRFFATVKRGKYKTGDTWRGGAI